MNLLKIPAYCDYYKNLLIEDIVFQSNPMEVHYGLCSVIGRIWQCSNTRTFYLENIKIPSINKEYQLYTGSIKLRLVQTCYKHYLPVGLTVEVFGDIVFYNKLADENDMENILLKTSKDIINYFNNLYYQEQEKKSLEIINDNDISCILLPDENHQTTIITKTKCDEIIEKINIKYEPAIKIHSIIKIDQANELIALNLELKLIREQRKQCLKDINI